MAQRVEWKVNLSPAAGLDVTLKVFERFQSKSGAQRRLFESVFRVPIILMRK
jgi:hypothetical protein